MWDDPLNNAEEAKTRTKICIVRTCKSTSTRNVNKRFLTVPKNVERRIAWLNACGKDPESVSSSAKLYVCGDHFNFEEDITNYMQFKYYPGQRVFLKPDVVPHIFPDPEQTSSEDESSDPSESSSSEEWNEDTPILSQHEGESPDDDMFWENSDNDKVPTPAASPRSHDSSETESAKSCEDEKEFCCEIIEAPTDMARTVAAHALCMLAEAKPPSSLNKSTQISVSVREKYVIARPHYRSKYTQCSPKIQDAVTSTCDLNFVVSGGKKVTFSFPEPTSLNNLQSAKSGTPSSVDLGTPSQSVFASGGSSVQYKGTPTSEEISEENEYTEDLGYTFERCVAIRKIQNGLCLDDPMFNLGLPKSHITLLTTLGVYTKTDPLHIMICLKKIRLNQSMKGLGADFGFSESYVTKIFQNVVPKLAQCFSSLVLWPSKKQIKEKMPLAFRARYANTQSIIDCFEVEIEKPSDPVKQSLSWSSYKQCNTIKYLISCTPDGYINFVSKGFGGRTSDTKITEMSGFLDNVPENAGIMADRGFKGVAPALERVKCVLIRPPSVSAGVQSSKEEVMLTKQIASLRIHIERVIRRLREFEFLKPRACVHHSLVKYLDNVVKIVCGLVNLQSPLMKVHN